MDGVRSGTMGVLASVTLHAGVVLWLPSGTDISIAGQVNPQNAPITARQTETAIPFELVATPTPTEPTPPVGAPLSAAGEDSQGDQAGGDDRSWHATWLLDESHALTLQDALPNDPRLSQVQRIRTADYRTSVENRRATPNPGDNLLVTTGDGWILQRGEYAVTKTAPGQPRPTTKLGSAIRAPHGDTSNAAAASAGAPGGVQTPVARGIKRGSGDRPSRTVAMQTARPDVDQGSAATLTNALGSARDKRDAELRAAQLVEAFMQAGSAPASQQAAGRGGASLSAIVGAGRGTRPGGTHSAHGPGGDGDPGGEPYLRWYAEQRDRISRNLVFPRARQLAMDQGTTLLRVALNRMGELQGSPQLLRSSGFDDLDAAALSAVLGAAPFSPLPDEISPGDDRVRISVPIQFWNPTVR